MGGLVEIHILFQRQDFQKNSYIVQNHSQRPVTDIEDIDDEDKDEEDDEDGTENNIINEYKTDSCKMFAGFKDHRSGEDSTILELDMNSFSFLIRKL